MWVLCAFGYDSDPKNHEKCNNNLYIYIIYTNQIRPINRRLEDLKDLEDK